MKKKILLMSLAGVAAGQAALFSSGELDFGVHFEGGELEIEAHVVSGVLDGVQTDDEEFEASEIQVLVRADRQFVATPALAVSGAAAGDPLWILPQSQVAGVPYVALASEELTAGDWATAITFSLGSVTSPSGSGTFSMWNSDPVGNPLFHFSSSDPGATNDQNKFLSNFSHDHVNWGFTEPGEWLIELTASGTPAGAQSPVSATATLSFSVIPEPSTSLLAGLSILCLAGRRSRK